MRKKIVIILAVIFGINTLISAQMNQNKYENNWKEVANFERKSAPKSALNVVDRILKQAVEDKNTQQVVKALIHKAKYENQIDRTDYIELISDLETLSEQTDNIEDKSLLNSMIAELYLNYYQNNRHSIDQRTAIVDYVPENIKEWSTNIFIDKIIKNLDTSTNNIKLLKTKTNKDYADIILLGEDRVFYPTLYDFLMYRAIKCLKQISDNYKVTDSQGKSIDDNHLSLPADQYIQLDIPHNNKNALYRYYQNYLKELLANKQITTVIITEIDKAQSLKYNYNVDKDQLSEVYKKLIDKYKDNDACVEIIYQIVIREYSHNDAESKDNAYQMCIEALKKYPNYYRIDILKDWLKNVEIPNISAQGSKIYDPSQNIQIKLIHNNIDTRASKSVLKLYKINGSAFTFVKQYDIDVKSSKSYRTEESTIDLGKINIGQYCLVYCENTDTSKGFEDESSVIQFTVSSLFSFWRNSAKDEYEIYVVDRLSGKPIKNAIIKIYPNYLNKEGQAKATPKILKTNDQGLAIYKNTSGNKVYNYSIVEYSVSYNEEKELIKDNISKGNYDYSSGNTSSFRDDDKLRISTFTDRSIYRPGQTIYFKAIAVNQDNKIVANKELNVELYNSKSEIVHSNKLTSNDFGSISDEFTLPLNGLLGQYYFKVEDSYYNFRVEEYKRPTFEVKFEQIEDTYSFDKPLTIKGYAKSYSGISLQDADVEYTINKSPFSFWGMRSYSEFVESGTIKTNKDGVFEITFVPTAIEDNNNRWLRGVCSFTVKATVKDLNGEVQSSSHNIVVGDASMFINITIPYQIEKSKDVNCQITASNLNGKSINTSGNYIIYSLNENDSIHELISTGSFVTGKQVQLIQNLKELSSGKYQIEIIAHDNQSKEVKAKRNIVLYSFDDDRPPYKTDKWVLVKNATFSNEKPAEIIFGSSNDNLYLLYTLHDNSKVYNRELHNINNKNAIFAVYDDQKYNNEMVASFTFVKDGNLVTENINIKREAEREDIALNVKLDVFRDKLYPGDEETWTVSVKDKNNNPASAELLASMYDVSLDQLLSRHPMNWYLNRFYTYTSYVYPIYFNSSYQYPNVYSNIILNQTSEIVSIRNLDFDAINWFGTLRNYSNNIYGFDEVLMNYKPAPPIAIRSTSSSALVGSLDESVIASTGTSEAALENEFTQKAALPEENSGESSNIRVNLNETAFFYPFLRTNEKGETLISFKVPDSNTTWKFRALAHDKDAKYGLIEKMIVTQKELMVTPNLPRFVRQGDQTCISTKISNLSDKDIEGNVKIKFFDPSTNQILDIKIDDQIQPFSIQKGTSGSASWLLNVPNNIEMIGCRIIADNDDFSDGEQHLLSVLPNRILVTESMPIDITQSGKTEYTFDKFINNTSKTSSDYQLTFEFTNNPAWYAIQALPTLDNPTNENSVNWFASYYVNSLGASIVKRYPQIASMIQEWKKQDDKTVVSNLEKNQELKTILLEETPWVLDAKNETEQMEALSQLFDTNNINNKTNIATNKLIELQNQNGGWAWYKDMHSNRSITQYILYGYAKLQNVGLVEYQEPIKRMQINALRYIDDQIKNDFSSLKLNKDWEKSNKIRTSQLEYLYVRSFYRDIPIDQEAREAERFYTKVASNNWTQLDLYERSLLAVLLEHNGEKELANTITNSIREHAVVDDKQGMYWPNNRSNVFMSLSAISTHVFLVDAMLVNGASKEELDTMKRWLIKQKQVKGWSTTHASIDAISMLLSNGNDWFTSDSDTITIQLGDKVLNTQNIDLGTGYIKESWAQPEIKKDMGKVEIQSNASRPSYGAVYWQYYEDLDKIKLPTKGGLQIKKQIFKEVIDSNGKMLSLVSSKKPLQVGDKAIVRLVVEADLDMDFVQIKDMRASCFEPTQVLSGTRWQDRLFYYQTTKDASTNFYLDHLPKGTYVFEYPMYVTRQGVYSDGITTIQCAYAPEFVSHTENIQLIVK